jgi:hypothetical protein
MPSFYINSPAIMDVEPLSKIEAKAEKLRREIEHLNIKYELELKLRAAKYNLDLKKLELQYAQLHIKEDDDIGYT